MSHRPFTPTKRHRRDSDALTREQQRRRHRHELRMRRGMLRCWSGGPCSPGPLGLQPWMIRDNRERRRARERRTK